MKKYAVIVKAISPHPWTETVESNKLDAEDAKRFIMAHLRGVEVSIEEFEEQEDE